MSWVRWQGVTLPVTDDEARLRVHVRAPDVPCPRLSWSLDVSHYVRAENPDEKKMEVAYWVDAEVTDLRFYETDWRRLSNLAIRADAKWQEAHELINEYGREVPAQVNVMTGCMKWAPPVPSLSPGHTRWLAHDFILRIGARDGLCFPCELDAWMIPYDQYYRKEPERLAEVARFAETPPNLQIITRARFEGGSVEVPRCKDDPIPWARRLFQEATGCDQMFQPELKWALRSTPDNKEIVPMPGYRSTVHFSTMPSD